MTFENFARALRAFNRRQPFRFFFIELNTGYRIQARHPEAVALRGELALFFPPDDTHILFDSTSVCRVYDEVPPERPA
jgi:hypothetical protein